LEEIKDPWGGVNPLKKTDRKKSQKTTREREREREKEREKRLSSTKKTKERIEN
jgi:hypothetical protein